MTDKNKIDLGITLLRNLAWGYYTPLGVMLVATALMLIFKMGVFCMPDSLNDPSLTAIECVILLVVETIIIALIWIENKISISELEQFKRHLNGL